MTKFPWLFDPDPQPRHIKGQWSWFGLWLIATLIGGFLLKPSAEGHGTHTQLGLPKCYSVIMFDRPCPGCGMTTSWTATIHGKLQQATKAHPFGAPIYGLFTLTALLSAYASIRKLRLRSETRLATLTLIALISSFLLFGIIRFATTTYNDPTHKIFRSVNQR
jgi:prepilin signal peptidase PulO-like enzyme (type II secretory pathway)